MVVEAKVRAAAVGGVATMWSYFTLKIFKICKQIVYPPEKIYKCGYCSYHFTSDFLSDRRHFYVCKHCEEKEDVCGRCGERFFDDEELEIRYGDEKDDKPLCKNCFFIN